MNIEITEKYKASLIPFPKETLEPLKLPTEIFEFLTETGLPLHAGYEITPNAPLTFFDMPYIKKHAHLQNTFLDIASMDMMGELTIDMKTQEVYQIQKGRADSWGNSVEIPVFANDSIGQFIDCLGIWLSFYQQLRYEVDKNLAINPKFSLFDHKEMYEPILNKLKEIDPESVKWRKYFWRRMCEPDIL